MQIFSQLAKNLEAHLPVLQLCSGLDTGSASRVSVMNGVASQALVHTAMHVPLAHCPTLSLYVLLLPDRFCLLPQRAVQVATTRSIPIVPLE